MEPDLSLRVIHSLPSRLRLRLATGPNDPEEMGRTVKRHPGIAVVSYSRHTGSVLLRYDPGEISQEELIIRVAVFISLENGQRPVRVYSDSGMEEMAGSAFLSGFLIVASLASRLAPQLATYRNPLDWAAGIGTAYSIVDHAYGELKERDNFDPEALSIIYLLTSFTQGRFLPATLFSWVATFGRHLMKFAAKNVEIYPRKVKGAPTDEPRYEVVIDPIKKLPGRVAFFRFLPALIMHASMGDGSSIQGTLLEEIKKVSQDHGDMLEGFGKLKDGMAIRFH